MNELLVARGYAQTLTIPPNVAFAARLAAAARRARRARAGLWGVPGCAAGAGDTRGGARRCSDFATQGDAQRWFDAHPGGFRPDGDADGRVCESLPP